MARGAMSRRVASLSYRHAEDGHWYKHDFAPGVDLRPRADGSVELSRPDGKPVWDRFSGTPGRFLVNPPGGSGDFRVDLYDTKTFGAREQGGAGGFDSVDDAAKWARATLKKAGQGSAVVTAYGGVKASLAYNRGRLTTRKVNPGGAMTVAELATKAHKADDAFSRELRKQFGRQAVNRRYSYKRDDWSPALRRASEQRDKALAEYTAALEAGRRTNPKGARMARRKSRKRRKARAVRRHRTRAATRTNPGRRRKRPVRHNPGGAMARKRRKHRRNPARAHRRRRASTRRNPPMARHRRRSYRRNPGGGGILGGITRGIMSGATVTGGQILGVVTARQLGGLLKDGTVKTGTTDYTPAVRQAVVAVAGTVLAGMSRRGGRLIEQLITGLWAAPVQSAVRAANIPMLSSGLGECDTLGGYAPVSRLSGYAPRSLPAPAGGLGDGYAESMDPGSSYQALGLQ